MLFPISQQLNIGLIKKSSDSLLRIINDVLDYSKIEAGKVIVKSNPFRLKDVMNEVVALFSVSAMQKGLEINLVLDPNIPDLIIGDNVKLRQVLSNLLGNAIKFTSKGSIHIIARHVSDEKTPFILDFSVQDTGIGISREKQALLFERFTQLDSSYTKEYQGTGLGLAISKKLVEMMGGNIWVQSDEGMGSTFFFTATFKVSHEKEPDSINHLPMSEVAAAADSGRKKF